MDRYGLAREFELRKFEMQVMKMTDLYQVQEIAIKLFSQTLAQRRVYEDLLRGHPRAAAGQVIAYLSSVQVRETHRAGVLITP